MQIYISLSTLKLMKQMNTSMAISEPYICKQSLKYYEIRKMVGEFSITPESDA
jgi:hypothetical protein